MLDMKHLLWLLQFTYRTSRVNKWRSLSYPYGPYAYDIKLVLFQSKGPIWQLPKGCHAQFSS